MKNTVARLSRSDSSIRVARDLDAEIERRIAGTGMTKQQFVADAIRTHLSAGLEQEAAAR
jgi:hypothetical protein